MDIELLKEELFLKDKEISLLLARCKENVTNPDFSGIINDLSVLLKEKPEYKNESDISKIKNLINLITIQHNTYKNELLNKDNQVTDILKNMEEIISEKDKEIASLQNKIYSKDYNCNIITDNLKLSLKNKEEEIVAYEDELYELYNTIENNTKNIQSNIDLLEQKNTEITQLNEHLIDANFVIYNHDKMIKNLNKYISQLEYDKTDLNDTIIDKDVEIYKLYQDIDNINADKNNEIEMYKCDLNNLDLKHNILKNEMDELKIYNYNCLDLITKIKKFISEYQESNFPLFNPIRILENLISLYHEKLFCGDEIIIYEYKKSNRC